MEEGLLSLKWNHHKSTFFQVLSILREKHTYTDVTLACDGRLYPVHKFILSTCSEYFSDIFTSNTGNNIVIVLKDVRRQDLEYLLDYMYLGQVDVAQSELSSLIKTAECLRIKGLAIPDDEPHTATRRVVEEKERDPSPPSKKKRLHGDDNRIGGVSSNNVSNRIPPILSIQPPSLPPSTPQQHTLRLQPLSQQAQPSPTSQPNSKSHTLSLPPHTASSRTSQIPSSPLNTSSSHTSQAPPHSSPTQSNPIPVIKQEVTDPLESDYGQENYEDTKPDVSDSHHLEQDMAVAGPSGIQGSAENWDGEGDLASFGSGDAYPESGMEESVDSEAQGDALQGADGFSRSFGRHSEPVYGCNDSQSRLAKEADSALTGDLANARKDTCKRQRQAEGTNQFGGKKKSEGSELRSSDLNIAKTSEPIAEIVYDSSCVGGDNSSSSSQDFPVVIENLLPSALGSSSIHPQSSGDNHLGSDYSMTEQQEWNHLLGYESSRYVCQWCGRTFDRISNLKRHVLLHSGIKPFKCLYCNYRATQKANVVQHVASRHRDEMRALLNNNINVNDMLVPTSGMKG